jgi:hypothetical protein
MNIPTLTRLLLLNFVLSFSGCALVGPTELIWVNKNSPERNFDKDYATCSQSKDVLDEKALIEHIIANGGVNDTGRIIHIVTDPSGKKIINVEEAINYCMQNQFNWEHVPKK